MKRIIILPVLMILTFTAYSQGFSVRKGGHAYTLEIPDYLVKTYDLNSVASLQYMNVDKEAYVIVIEDAKELLENRGLEFSGPDDFLNSFLTDFHKDDKDRKIGALKQFVSNGNKHSQVEMSWEAEEELKFYMIVTVVESNTHFYKILTWTLAENQELLKNDFLRVAKSLKD